MKICQVCNQTYADDNLNYCLTDGGILTGYNDDAPPTIMLNRARTTQQNWENYQTPPPWENQIQQQQQSYQSVPQNQPFYPAQIQGQDQTMPTVSLVLGIFAILFTCCWGGIPFGAAALIIGFLGLKNANENPMQYGGRGLAIGGIVTGVVALLGSVLFLILILAG